MKSLDEIFFGECIIYINSNKEKLVKSIKMCIYVLYFLLAQPKYGHIVTILKITYRFIYRVSIYLYRLVVAFLFIV